MANDLKTYRAPWQGQLLLACRKCQRKLKHDEPLQSLGRLKKSIKARNKQSTQQFHLISIPCMDVCPKDAVAICLPTAAPDRFLLLRSEQDIDLLYTQTCNNETGSIQTIYKGTPQ